MILIWQYLTAIAVCRYATAEVFSSTSRLKNLVQIESNLLSFLVDFLSDQQNKPEFVQNQYILLERLHQSLIKDPHLHQPLNAYRAIKSLTIDLHNIENAIVKIASSAQMFDLAVIKDDPMLPSYDDFSGAVRGLVGLQETYNLQTASLAAGVINGVQYDSNLTASDCYELGRELYQMHYYSWSVRWLKETVRKSEHEDVKSVETVKILEQYVYALIMAGDETEALKLIPRLLPEKVPEITKNVLKLKVESEQIDKYQNVEVSINFEGFKEVCRGEATLTLDETDHLKCKLITRMPLFSLKIEEIYVNISFVAYVYHDVLSHNEMTELIGEAEDHIERAHVLTGGDASEPTTAPHHDRTAQQAILSFAKNKFVNERVKVMTGFNMELDEIGQIVNYGLGGQYLTHVDYLGADFYSREREVGDRIATVLFYLGDVEQGGATVFPRLRIAAKPEKGSALVWYNLLPDGQPNPRSYHCGCPVLVGSKWIVTKWVHERQQIFTRPCTNGNHLWRF